MLVCRVGFEPTTLRLRVPCSTTELPARYKPFYILLRMVGCYLIFFNALINLLWVDPNKYLTMISF